MSAARPATDVEILRREPAGKRVIPGTADRARLLANGRELDHDVEDIIGVVQHQTCSRWLREH